MPKPDASRSIKPKILLIDLPESTTAELTALGFNAVAGSFGQAYEVPPGDRVFPVISNARLPNYTEQEIVVIDLSERELLSKADELPEPTPRVYARCLDGIIDPRPATMAAVSSSFNRILEAGGVFVVFVEPRATTKYLEGSMRTGLFRIEREVESNNWSFLPLLAAPYSVRVKPDHGFESSIVPVNDVLVRFLRKHQIGMESRAVLAGDFPRKDYTLVPLLLNKFGDCIGGILVPDTPKMGRIFLFPHVANKADFVSELIREILPIFSIHLFPDYVGGRWVFEEAYEHPSILERRQRQRRLQAETDLRIEAIECEIKDERARLNFLHNLLTDTGDSLVQSVMEAFGFIGFAEVKVPTEENGASKQEDLQILDRSPALLLEVKGLLGMPTEGDSHQVLKYVVRRTREWGRIDVRGLFVVNHQRSIPGLARDHANVFTPQQVSDALEGATGLITTWELFSLIRAMNRWKWPSRVVRDRLYESGRIGCIPSHYSKAGSVAHYYSNISVLSVDVEKAIRVGSTVAYYIGFQFFEEEITSLEIDRVAVREAMPGQRVGFRTLLKRSDIPVGTAVYLVDLSPPSEPS